MMKLELEEAIKILKDTIISLNNPVPFKYTNYKKSLAIETVLKELEQEKEKNNNLIKQLQEQNAEIEDIAKQLRQEKENNKELEKYKKYYEEMEEVNKKFIAVDKIKEIVDNHILKKPDIITGKMEYTPDTNANSFVVQDILDLLEE